MSITGEIRVAECGSIRVTSRMIWTGKGYERLNVDWWWDGPPVAVARCELFDGGKARGGKLVPGERVVIGPYAVRILEYDFLCDSYLVRRVDQYRLLGWWLGLRLRALRWLGMVGERVVLTLAVWGLAEWPAALHLRRRWWRRANDD